MNREKSRARLHWGNGFPLLPWIGVAITLVSLRENGATFAKWSLGGISLGRPQLNIPITFPLVGLLILGIYLLSDWARPAGRLRKVLMALAVLTLSLIPPAFHLEPRGIQKFLVDSGVSGTLYVDPRWSNTDFSTIKGLRRAHREIAQVVALSHRNEIQIWQDPRFLPIFENNLGVIALRYQRGDTVNLSAVREYYRAQGLVFDPGKGFELARVARLSSPWVRSFEDRLDSRWPFSLRQQTRNALADANFYYSRRTPLRAIDRLIEALEITPRDPYLIAHLQRICLALDNFPEAHKWQQILEEEPIPDDLLASTQHDRFVLLERERLTQPWPFVP